jgi:hypothetical protein
VAVPCAEGRYGDAPGQVDERCSGACPFDEIEGIGRRQRVTLGTGTTSVTGCICQAGFYLKACVECELGSECVECAEGADCREKGVTLAELPLAQGWWRVTPDSTDVRPCNVKAACDHSGHANATSIWAERQCADGYLGPLCGACEEKHYATASGVCTACDGSEWPAWLAAGVVIGAALGLFGYLLFRSAKARNAADEPGRMERFASRVLRRAARLNTKFR